MRGNAATAQRWAVHLSSLDVQLKPLLNGVPSHRPSETIRQQRLIWFKTGINLADKLIDVTKSKNSISHRFVKISDNLVAGSHPTPKRAARSPSAVTRTIRGSKALGIGRQRH